jgi:hypothetical protein
MMRAQRDPAAQAAGSVRGRVDHTEMVAHGVSRTGPGHRQTIIQGESDRPGRNGIPTARKRAAFRGSLAKSWASFAACTKVENSC